MNAKKLIAKLGFLILWGAVFFISMRYIGAQWEYEGLLTRGLIVGISLRSAAHILYSIATALASAVIATSILAFLLLLIRKRASKMERRGFVFSFAAVALIFMAFAWNRYNIRLGQLPVEYQYYDSTGRLHEPEKYLPNLRNVNVILISIDTLNPKHLGCYGYDRNTSPTIDSLAKAGMLFENAFSHSPKTTPAHLSMFTSLYPSVHKVNNWNKYEGGYALDHRIITLPEILKNAGYHTAAFTGGGNVQSSIGFGSGFDVYDNDEQVWSSAFDWLDQNHQSKFFLFLHTFRVHSPYLPPPPYNTMFGEKYQGKIIDTEQGLQEYFKQNYNADDDFPGSHELFWESVDKGNPRDLKRLVALYDGCIRFMNDRMVAVLLNRLGKYDLLKNTLIIFTSDHGEEFLEHGDFLHKELYDEHIQVPLIMRFPENSYKKKIVQEQVTLIDLLPTLLDYLGLPIPEMAQGISLMSFIAGQEMNLPAFSERTDISDVPDMKKAIRTLEWKYIWWPTKKMQELYNLSEDPGEQINVAEKYPEAAAGLHRQVLEWMQENESRGQTIRTFTHTLEQKTIDKLKSLGYIR
jgi:arylsulfatase A-like enzyme